MTVTTKDGIAVQLEIGQVFTTPEECDLIGRTFSDGDTTGTVQRVELTRREDGLLYARLVFGQNEISIYKAYQVCEWCFGKMEWLRIGTSSYGEPYDYEDVYTCYDCAMDGTQAQGNVINEYELPI